MLIQCSDRNRWATPKQKFEKMVDRWWYQGHNPYPAIDVCADANNTKCDVFWTEQDDSLSFDWVDRALALGIAPLFWMNCPYTSTIMIPFIKQAIQAGNKGGITHFCLPAFTDQAWFHDLIKPYPHDFTRGRIKFEPPLGIKASTPRYGNVYGVICPQHMIAEFKANM